MKKLRALLSAALTIMLSVSIGAAGTYALFSDNVEVTNHLQAGTLELGLTRTKLVKSVPDATTGMPTKTEDTAARDFSAATSENVFGIGDEKIAPGSWDEVEMHVINCRFRFYNPITSYLRPRRLRKPSIVRQTRDVRRE